MENISKILSTKNRNALIIFFFSSRNTNVADINNMEDDQNITWEEMDKPETGTMYVI